ncbi:class I SAM-dependent methyltransferase [Candidatus Woesearchaeota archaeon]|nr:class I SAM-dependent methyltransferase [Candidatus Woesearchaeota archaeon]
MGRYKETKLSYDQHAGWHIQKSNRYNWNKQIEGFVNGFRGRRILDVGCGGGRDIAEFLRRGLKADGLDYSAETIKVCRQKFPDAAFFIEDMKNIRNIWKIWAKRNISNKRDIGNKRGKNDIGNIRDREGINTTMGRDVSLPNGKYDGVWACASILNIRKSEVPDVLSGIRSVLKKHGRLFVSVKKGKGERMVHDSNGKRFFSFFSPSEIKSLVEQSGFKVTFSETVPDAELTGKSPKPVKPDWICLYAENSC